MLAWAGLQAGPAHALSCTGTDDALRPLPQDAVAEARTALHLPAVPDAAMERGTVWRCVGGRPLACFVGANLPCGKLDRRVRPPAVASWCRGHPRGPVPATVAGHDALWRFRCAGGRAERDGLAWQPDPRGFATELWRPLPAR